MRWDGPGPEDSVFVYNQPAGACRSCTQCLLHNLNMQTTRRSRELVKGHVLSSPQSIS